MMRDQIERAWAAYWQDIRANRTAEARVKFERARALEKVQRSRQSTQELLASVTGGSA